MISTGTMGRAFLVTCVLLLDACSRQVPLAYVSTTPLSAISAPAVIGQVTTTDARNEADPTWIGAVRGGYGNPLKVLHTPRPLNEMVTSAFRDALQARGWLAPSGQGRLDLAVRIVQFESSQVARREADVDFAVNLVDRGTGQTVYMDEAKIALVTGSILALDTGAFGSSEDLQAVAQTAMNQAIDNILNKPAFVAALGARRAP